jgi:hypothetical protein
MRYEFHFTCSVMTRIPIHLRRALTSSTAYMFSSRYRRALAPFQYLACHCRRASFVSQSFSSVSLISEAPLPHLYSRHTAPFVWTFAGKQEL